MRHQRISLFCGSVSNLESPGKPPVTFLGSILASILRSLVTSYCTGTRNERINEPLPSRFKPSSKARHIFGVNPSSNTTKPRYICPVHVLQRRVEQRRFHIHCRVRYILPIREHRTVQCIQLFAHSKGKGVIERGVRPQVDEDGLEKRLRPVWWIGRP